MMKTNLIKSIFLFGFFGLLLYSCETDPGVDTDKSPTIVFANGTGADQVVKPSEVAAMTITVAKGSNDINAIEVREDGVKVAFDRISYKGSAVSANPFLILGTEKQGFTSEIGVKAASAIGAKTIEIIVIDQLNKTASASKKVTTEALPPSLVYKGPDVVEGVAVNTLNQFKFDLTKGSGKITQLEVKENGIKMDAGRCEFDGKTFLTNPETIAGAAADGFVNKNVGVRTPAVASTYEYTFTFTDEFGLKVEKKVTVKIGNPITFTKTDALLNSAGPNGTGGFDLDEGLGTGSDSPSAEIKDLGIDTSLPVATNWRQVIAGISPTELRHLAIGVAITESFDLNSIVFTEQIKDLFDKGNNVTNGSAKVAKGNVFAAKKGEKYYIFQVADVVITTNDNADKYLINIKW